MAAVGMLLRRLGSLGWRSALRRHMLAKTIIGVKDCDPMLGCAAQLGDA